MYLDKHAMYVLRTLLTGEYLFEKKLFFRWNTEEKLDWLQEWSGLYKASNLNLTVMTVVNSDWK